MFDEGSRGAIYELLISEIQGYVSGERQIVLLSAVLSNAEQALKGKLIIHRYDAFSTNSIYLKFDYGVANSLRISDHSGYDYLSYRYNIILGLENWMLNIQKILMFSTCSYEFNNARFVLLGVLKPEE